MTWIGGALSASAAAGPIVVVPLALAGLHAGQGWGWQELGSFVLIVVLSLPFGFAFSLIPNVVGTALLAWAGTRWRLARHPLVWSAAGWAFGWLIVTVASGDVDPANGMLAIVGLFCALLCRSGTRWPD